MWRRFFSFYDFFVSLDILREERKFRGAEIEVGFGFFLRVFAALKERRVLFVKRTKDSVA